MPKTLIIHNFYSKANPSGENNVVSREKRTATDRFFVFSDVVLKKKHPLTSLVLFFRYKRKVKNRLKSILRNHSYDQIIIHNTFPFIGTRFFSHASNNTKISLHLHNYRYLVTCATFVDPLGNHCDLCIRKKHRFSPLVLWWKCYNGSFIRTMLIYMKLISLYLRNDLKRVDELIYFSEYQKSIMMRLFRKDAEWTQKLNKIDFTLNVKSWTNRSRKNKFIFVGRLSNEKGLGLLLDAWENWRTDIKLEIYGSGPLEERVRAVSKTSNVHFKGYLDKTQKQRVMSDGAILLFPSQCVEGHPLVLEEAKTVGMPGLYSTIGPLSEYTKNSLLRPLNFTDANLRNLLQKYYNEVSQ